MSFWQWCLHRAKTCSLSFISVGKAEVVLWRYVCWMRLWRLDRDGPHWWFAVRLLQCYIRAAGFRWLSKVWLRGGCLWFETMWCFWGWFIMKCQVWQTGSTHRRCKVSTKTFCIVQWSLSRHRAKMLNDFRKGSSHSWMSHNESGGTLICKWWQESYHMSCKARIVWSFTFYSMGEHPQIQLIETNLKIKQL